MKVLILGGSGHGKTTVEEYMSKTYGLRGTNASLRAAEVFIWDAMAHIKPYDTPQECYDDRHNYYSLWLEMVAAYNKEDKGRLVREVMKDADVYTGIRSAEVYEAVKGWFDLVLYVCAEGRVEPDPNVEIDFDPHTMRRVDNGFDSRHAFDDVDFHMRRAQFQEAAACT